MDSSLSCAEPGPAQPQFLLLFDIFVLEFVKLCRNEGFSGLYRGVKHSQRVAREVIGC